MTGSSQTKLANRESTSALQKLEVLKDSPLSDSDFAAGRDIFNHEAFAETLLKLLTQNPPPLSIGLFGSWGIGKSTAVNILFSKLRSAPHSNTLKPIYFNAWKYSGDSFRRQFLIEVAKQILGESHSTVARLEQLNYSDVLKEKRQTNICKAVKEVFEEAFKAKIVLKTSAVVRFIIACGALLAGVGLATVAAKFSSVLSALILSTLVPAIFLWLVNLKFEELFIIQESPVIDPQLVFPEQFEREFRSLLNCDEMRGKSAVIAIDDIDRCEPSVIRDVLISTKTFIGEEKCFFIIPCDDKTVVEVFDDPNQKLGYKDESLRKYFNVGVRIPPINSTDLVDFANMVARQFNLPDGIVQIAILGNCRDARKMKHFLNGLSMKYNIAKAREATGRMPKLVDENILELCKAVLIEDAYPELFMRIVENPRVFHVIEQSALGYEQDGDELSSLGLANWQTSFPGLKEVLERTRDVKMTHADVFFSLKTSNPEVRIPRGTELRNSLIEGDLAKILEIAKGIDQIEEKRALADLVIDVLRKAKDRFLHNAIKGALHLYSTETVFSSVDRSRVAHALSNALVYRDNDNVLFHSAEEALRCAQESGGARLEDLLALYLHAFEAPELQVHVNINETISSIYCYVEDRRSFANALNERFERWAAETTGLVMLEALRLPPNITVAEKIPSDSLVQKLVTSLNGDVEYDLLRRRIIFTHWKSEYAEPIAKFLTGALQKPQDYKSYDGEDSATEIDFVVTSIILQPDIASAQSATPMWIMLRNGFNESQISSGKLKISKAICLFGLSAHDSGVRTAASEFSRSICRSLSDAPLRQLLDFAIATALPDARSFVSSVLTQEFAAITAELQNPTERTKDRLKLCTDFDEYLAPDSLGSILTQGLDVSRDSALKEWISIASVHKDSLDDEFWTKYVSRCIELLATQGGHPEKQELFGNAAISNLDKITGELRSESVRKLLRLLLDRNESTRNTAATLFKQLRAVANEADIRLEVSQIVNDLRQLPTVDVRTYSSVIDALIQHSDLFGDYVWRDLGDTLKRLLASSDVPAQEFGLRLLFLMSVIYSDQQREIVHALLSIARGGSSLSEKAVEAGRQIRGKISDRIALSELNGLLPSEKKVNEEPE